VRSRNTIIAFSSLVIKLKPPVDALAGGLIKNAHRPLFNFSIPRIGVNVDNLTALAMTLKCDNIMTNPFSKFYPADLIALICIIGGLILIGMKIDTVVGGLISLIAGYYFGHKSRK
jgi:hypothetical protein